MTGMRTALRARRTAGPCRVCGGPAMGEDRAGRPVHDCCALADSRGAPCPACQGPEPVVGGNDPPSSYEAAERAMPKLGTRRREVLDALLWPRDGDGWVDGTELATSRCGGSEGLRRVRELQRQGWPVERRPDPDSATSWQYRIAAGAGVAG